MSIFKDTFRKYVRNQLSLREELVDIGNTNDSGERSKRHKSKIVKIRGKDVTIKPGAFFSYTTNRQCVIRMTSLVDYVEDVGLEIGGYGEGGKGFSRLKGATLSQNFILQGGVLSDYARNFREEKSVKRATTPRDSFPKPGLRTNLGYGDLALGADATSDGFGIVPMPGITDATIRTKSAYGSLREAKINFECHNRRQLEVLEMLFMRPGYMVLMEWGWTPHINNKGEIVSHLKLVEDQLKTGENESLLYTNNIDQPMVYNAINKLKEDQSGNYDGFLGYIKNFGFKAREDGGYSSFSELVTIGEVIGSLKGPSMSQFSPGIIGNSDLSTDEGSNIIIESSNQKADQFAKEYDVAFDRYGGGSSNGGMGTTCFVAGTKVTMADKTYKNIEDVKEGDKILSYNISTKKFGVDEVLPLPKILGNYKKIIAIYKDGTKNEFSPAHPFYIVGKGWASYDLTDKIISTGDCGDGRLENEWNAMFVKGNLHPLEVGDYCINSEGKKLQIKSLDETNEYVEMYNLEHLSNNKTWFANGVLVKE